MRTGMYTKLMWMCTAVLLGLSSCASSSATIQPTMQSVPSIPLTPPTENNPAKDKIIIVYVRGMDETDATENLIDQFNKQNNDIYVKYQELPYDLGEQRRQLILAMSSGETGYDVMDIDMVWNAEFAENGYSIPLDEYIKADGIDMGAYIPGAAEAAKYYGKTYAMPRNIAFGLLYYRNDIIESPPSTWDELITLSSELIGVKDTTNGYTFTGKISDSFVCVALELIYAYGGSLLDHDGNLSINKEETIKGLDKLYEIYHSQFVPSKLRSMTENDACTNFLDGGSVFMRSLPSAWVLGNHSGSKVAGKFSLAPLPEGDAGSGTLLTGYLSVINSKSKNKDKAWAFLKYLSGYEGQKLSAIQGGKIPTVKAVFSDSEAVSRNPHFSDTNFIGAIENAVPRPVTPHYPSFSMMFQEELLSFLYDQKTSEEVVTSIEEKMNIINGAALK